MEQNNNMIVVVTGLIGAGKTSVCESLEKSLKCKVFYEPLPETDNFMLEAYYKNPEKYAYSMQTLLLALRFQAQQEAQWRSTRGELCVMDSSIYADKAFLEVQKQCGFIDEYEYRAYNKLCEIHFPFLQYPDLHLHLALPIDEEINRIKKRSRDCECNIERDYLEKLNSAYDDLIPHLSKLYPVKIINADQNFDGVLQDCIQAIKQRSMEMEEQSHYPVYKKNTAFV